MEKMEIRFVFAVILSGIMAACSNPAGDTPIDTPQGGNKTYIAFNNTQGVCTAIVYGDARRSNDDIIEVVRAGASSAPREWRASASHSFFLSYQFAVPGAEENTIIYTPAAVGKDQVAVRIDADKTTTIPIPKLEDTLTTPNELLSAKSYLIIQNDAAYSFTLMRGSSEVKPENLGGTVVNAGEKALYTVNGGAAASAYTLLVGASSVNFPASPAQFAAGHVYRFVYTGAGITAPAQGGETPLDVTTIAAQGAGGGEIPAVPAGLVVTGVTFDSVSLSWNAVNGADGYRIYRAASADGAFYQIGSRAAAQTPSYTDSGLLSSTAYYYKVSAVNAVGESGLSAAVEGKPGLLTITELNLSGVIAVPVKDAIPQTTAGALGHSQYTVTSLAWQTASGGAASGVFAAGTVYKAILRLQAQGTYTFAGLGSNVFTFSGATSVTAAVTGQTATVTVTFPAVSTAVLSVATADELAVRLNWIRANGQPNSFYAIMLTADISIGPQTLNASVNAAYRNITIMLVGQGGERTIALNTNGSLFTIESYNATNKFTFILGNDIKLQGRSSNTASVVRVNQYAEFIMRGGTISGNTASSYGGGVYVNGGTFTMSGGTISGNTSSGNASSSSGGGVYVDSGTFTMSGGTISGNTSSYFGGGVYVNSGGIFTKSGNSIIYGNDADATLKNTALSTSFGHAVYGSGSKKRNATAYAPDTMDSSLSGYAGGWE